MKIEITGIDQVNKRLERLARLDYTPALKQSAEDLKEEYSERSFSQKGANLGSRWPARKDNFSHPLLNKTGKMKGNFRTRVTSRQSVIYNPTKYFPYHQLGTRNIPQRPMLGLNSKLIDRVAKIFTAFIRKEITR